MASSRHLPLSYNTSTFGGVTRDYQSLSVWEAATDNDLVTATDGEVLDCYADSASYDQSITIESATTDSDYFRVIRAASGQGHTGSPGTGFKIAPSEGPARCIYLRESYSSLYDLDIQYDANNIAVRNCIQVAKEGPVNVVGCLIKCTNSGTGGAGGILGGAALAANYINNLFYECKEYGLKTSTANEGIVYNNTIVNNVGTGLQVEGTTRVKNNIYQDNGTDLVGTPTTSITNVSSGVVFIDAANDNYFLDPSDTVAQGQGTNLSADANYAFDDDVIGATRPFGTEWDIGFEECCDVELSGSGINSLGMTLTMN